MRDLSADARLLSRNTATIRERWGLGEAIDGCVRHGLGRRLVRLGFHQDRQCRGLALPLLASRQALPQGLLRLLLQVLRPSALPP